MENTRSQPNVIPASGIDIDRLQALAREIELIRKDQEHTNAEVRVLAKALDDFIELGSPPDSIATKKSSPPGRGRSDSQPARTPENQSGEVAENNLRMLAADEELRWATLVESAFAKEFAGSADGVSAGVGFTKAMEAYASQLGVRIDSVECRETICISELDFPPGEDVDRFTFAVVANMGWSSMMRYRVTENLPNGSIRVKFYLTRDGHTFPAG
jgi:hypothetical protein